MFAAAKIPTPTKMDSFLDLNSLKTDQNEIHVDISSAIHQEAGNDLSVIWNNHDPIPTNINPNPIKRNRGSNLFL